jgi:hypothetical protein
LGLQYRTKGVLPASVFSFATSDSIIYLRFSFWQNHIGKLTQWNQVVSFIGNSNFPQENASSFVNYFSCCRNNSVAFGFQMIGCDLDPRTSLTSGFTKASARPHSLPKLLAPPVAIHRLCCRNSRALWLLKIFSCVSIFNIQRLH